MRSWTIAFSLGIMLCGFVPSLPSFPLVCCLLLASLLLHWWRRWRLLAAFGVGSCWLLLYAQHSVAELWPTELENTDVWVQGTVWNLPQQTERSLRFEFRVEKLCTSEALTTCDFPALPEVRKKVLINLYQSLPIRAGQSWQLQLRLRKPHGFANPGGFDYEAWLMQKQIRATGYVREHTGNLLLDDATGKRGFTRLRAALIQKLAEVGAGSLRYEHLIRALTVGDHYGITEDEWTLFSITGTNHLIVISGLHVGLIALAMYRLGWYLCTRWPPLLLRCPAPQCAALFALGGAWIYSGLAGFSLPVQRAFVMAAVLLAGKLLRRQTSAIEALCLALALILLLDPLAPQNAGFWLSYCAVAVLLFTVTHSSANPPVDSGTGPGLPRVSLFRTWLLKAWLELRTQLLVFIGLLPVMLVFFQQISPSAPLINIPAIPYIGLLVVPLSLLAIVLLWLWPGGSILLLKLVDALLLWYMQALAWAAAHAPFGLLQLPALPGALLLLLCALVLASLFAPRPWLRWGTLLLIPLVFLWPRTILPLGKVRLTVLDVGQGLAVVISTRHHHLLYDAGPFFSSRFDAGSDVVVPYLRHMNIRELETVIISHADADHAGGLAGVEKAFPQARYLGSDSTIFAEGLQSAACATGQGWQWDGVDFSLLHPATGGFSRNNGSCVLRIEVGESVILLPGDIERLVESRLLQGGLLDKATLLLAPHHGSRTSSSSIFVAQVAPEVVVYSSGYRNRFNHPAPDIQARYAAIGSRQLLTSSSGAITFEVSAAGIETIGEQRSMRRRFWAYPPERK